MSSDDVKANDVGLVSQAGGANAASAIRFSQILANDFDVSATIDIEQLAPSASAGLYFETSGGRRVGLWISRQDGHSLIIRGNALTDTDEPAFVQTNRKLDDLRLIRLQNTIFLAYTVNGSCRLLGSHDITDEPGQILMATDGKGPAPSTVTWKSLRIRSALQ